MAQLMLQTREAAARDRLLRSVRELGAMFRRFGTESPAFAQSMTTLGEFGARASSR